MLIEHQLCTKHKCLHESSNLTLTEELQFQSLIYIYWYLISQYRGRKPRVYHFTSCFSAEKILYHQLHSFQMKLFCKLSVTGKSIGRESVTYNCRIINIFKLFAHLNWPFHNSSIQLNKTLLSICYMLGIILSTEDLKKL